ncbi:MAG: signal peptidase I [Acidimicrobiia bacterium]
MNRNSGGASNVADNGSATTSTFVVSSGAMSPTFDASAVVTVTPLSGDVTTGTIVVFREPPHTGGTTGQMSIKRVIAIGADTVSAVDGVVSVNGQTLSEPYLNPSCGGTRDFGPVVVASGQLFVLGDTRCNSEDSRVYGPVDATAVVGVVASP